jgi:hypothetical protein
MALSLDDEKSWQIIYDTNARELNLESGQLESDANPRRLIRGRWCVSSSSLRGPLDRAHTRRSRPRDRQLCSQEGHPRTQKTLRPFTARVENYRQALWWCRIHTHTSALAGAPCGHPTRGLFRSSRAIFRISSERLPSV